MTIHFINAMWSQMFILFFKWFWGKGKTCWSVKSDRETTSWRLKMTQHKKSGPQNVKIAGWESAFVALVLAFALWFRFWILSSTRVVLISLQLTQWLSFIYWCGETFGPQSPIMFDVNTLRILKSQKNTSVMNLGYFLHHYICVACGWKF